MCFPCYLNKYSIALNSLCSCPVSETSLSDSLSSSSSPCLLTIVALQNLWPFSSEHSLILYMISLTSVTTSNNPQVLIMFMYVDTYMCAYINTYIRYTKLPYCISPSNHMHCCQENISSFIFLALSKFACPKLNTAFTFWNCFSIFIQLSSLRRTVLWHHSKGYRKGNEDKSESLRWASYSLCRGLDLDLDFLFSYLHYNKESVRISILSFSLTDS